MIPHAFRLKPHQDLKKEILLLASTKKIAAGCVLSCVGSLEQVHLRYADHEAGVLLKAKFEIISLTGTISPGHVHLHLCVADGRGQTLAGHLLDETLIYTTAEIVLAELPGVEFIREKDAAYGYPELVIRNISAKES